MTGRWIKEPWPEIIDVKDLGVFPVYDAYAEFRFAVTIKISAELECLDCGRAKSRNIEYGPYTIVLWYRILIIELVTRGWVKAFIYAVKIHRLLEFTSSNKELLQLVWNYSDEMISAVRNSADLICKGVFDPSQLEKYLPTRFCPPESCA